MTSEDERWVKLFRYLDKRFGEFDHRLIGVESRFNRFQNTLDSILGRLENIDQGNAAASLQLSRYERWAQHLAAKIGLKLEY